MEGLDAITRMAMTSNEKIQGVTSCASGYRSPLRIIRATMLVAGFALIGCAAQPVSPPAPIPLPATQQGGVAPQEQSGGASQWIGKTGDEVREKLGPPTEVQFLQETTGQMLIYANPGQPHYVFETGPKGLVVKAAEVH